MKGELEALADQLDALNRMYSNGLTTAARVASRLRALAVSFQSESRRTTGGDPAEPRADHDTDGTPFKSAATAPMHWRAIPRWGLGKDGTMCPSYTLDEGIEEYVRVADLESFASVASAIEAPSEERVAAAAKVIADSRLIDAPKLPAECWHGLARAILEAR